MLNICVGGADGTEDVVKGKLQTIVSAKEPIFKMIKQVMRKTCKLSS